LIKLYFYAEFDISVHAFCAPVVVEQGSRSVSCAKWTTPIHTLSSVPRSHAVSCIMCRVSKHCCLTMNCRVNRRSHVHCIAAQLARRLAKPLFLVRTA